MGPSGEDLLIFRQSGETEVGSTPVRARRGWRVTPLWRGKLYQG